MSVGTQGTGFGERNDGISLGMKILHGAEGMEVSHDAEGIGVSHGAEEMEVSHGNVEGMEVSLDGPEEIDVLGLLL